MTYSPINSKSAFLSTSETYPQDDAQLLIKLTSLHTDIANAINLREIALYQASQEVLTGQQFSIAGDNQKKNYVYRKVFYFGAIGAGVTLTAAHGVTGITQFTHIYGTCISTLPDFRPLPFISVINATSQVAVRADGTNFYISAGATTQPISSGILILEYLKS